MKRRHKAVLWIAGGLLSTIALLAIAVATFNWNRLKPYLGDRVSQAIGRPFAINGDLSVSWQRDPSGGGLIPWPQFTARDVTIGNPAWANQPVFAHLDALRFRLSPLPLLTQRIVVPSLQLVQPTVDLQRDRQGRANWVFAPTPSKEPPAWTLTLGSVRFDRGQLALDDAVRAIKLQATIEPLQRAIAYDQIVAQQSTEARDQAGKTVGTAARKLLSSHADADRGDHARTDATWQFSWRMQGSYQGLPARGHGRIGGVLALQQNDLPFPLQADVQLGDNHIALVGTLLDPTHLGAINVRLWFSGSSMAKLYPLTGLTLPDTPPYATEGHLRAELGADGGHYRYQQFVGRVGGTDLAGDLDYDSTGARPKLSGKLTSTVLQFSDLAPLIGADSNTSRKQRGDAPAQPDDKLLPVEPFRTERWRAMDADVQFNAARIVHGDTLPISALATHLRMDNGVLTLDSLHVGVASGTATGALTLDGGKTPMQGALKLTARHLKLKQLLPSFASMQTSFGEINGDAQLTARGNSVAALLGNANGGLRLLMNDGAISKTLLETAGLNVGNIVIGKLFGDKTVRINCAATDLAATNGVFDVRLFVFDTGDAVINMDGTVNLATEQLDLDVQPHTRGMRIFSLRSPLYVKGTLKNPDVGVQKGPLLLRGGGAVALAAVAAPAAALLALVAPSHGNDNSGNNTCHAVLDQLRRSGKMMPGASNETKAQ